MVVDRHDDGSASGQVDALIQAPDGPIPLEVVGDYDSAHLAMWKRLERIQHRLRVDGTAQGWIVWLKSSARINRIERELPGMLAEYEWPSDPFEQDELTPAMVRLGIVGLQPFGDPGVIRLQPEGWNSWDDPIGFVPWVERVLERAPDVARKLRSFDDAAGQAFIWATAGSPWLVNSTLRQDDDEPALPEHQPALPHGVSEVWIACTLTRRGCLHWSPERGWRRTGWITREEAEFTVL